MEAERKFTVAGIIVAIIEILAGGYIAVRAVLILLMRAEGRDFSLVMATSGWWHIFTAYLFLQLLMGGLFYFISKRIHWILTQSVLVCVVMWAILGFGAFIFIIGGMNLFLAMCALAAIEVTTFRGKYLNTRLGAVTRTVGIMAGILNFVIFYFLMG